MLTIFFRMSFIHPLHINIHKYCNYIMLTIVFSFSLDLLLIMYIINP